MSTRRTLPNVGLLYLRGLAVYSYYRMLEALESVRQRLLTPVRGLRRLTVALKTRWQRSNRRLLWTIALMVAITLLTGGAILLYVRRDIVRAGKSLLAARARQFWRWLWQPAVVIVQSQAEEIPVMPSLNTTERR